MRHHMERFVGQPDEVTVTLPVGDHDEHVRRVLKRTQVGRRVLLGYSEDQPRDDHGRWDGGDGGGGSTAKEASSRSTDGVVHDEQSPADVRANDRAMNSIVKDVGKEEGLRIEAHRVIGGHEMVWQVNDAGNWAGLGTYGRVGLDKTVGERWYGETDHGREYVGGPREGVNDVLEKSGVLFSLRAAGTRTVRRTGRKVRAGKADPLKAVQRASKRAARHEGAYRKACVAALEELAETAAEGFRKYATDTLTAGGRPPTQCMVAVYPRVEEAAAIAIPGGKPPEYLHVSLAIMDMKEVELDRDSLREAVHAVASTYAPLVGEVGGAGVFDRGWRGYPQILMPDVPGLSTLREEVVRELREAGFPFREVHHGFQPHLTVGYADTPTVIGEDRIGLPLHFDHLGLDHEGSCELVPFGAVLVAAASRGYVAARLHEIERTLAAARAGKAKSESVAAAVSALRPLVKQIVSQIASAQKKVDALLEAADADPVQAAVAQQQADQQVQQLRTAQEHLKTAADLQEQFAGESLLHSREAGKLGGEIDRSLAPVAAEEDGILPIIEKAAGRATRGGVVADLAEVGNVASWASAIPIDELLSQETIGDVYRAHTNPVRESMVKEFEQGTRQDLNINWRLTNPHVGAVLERTGQHVGGIVDTTRRDVEAIISRAYKDGLSIPDTADFIRWSMREAAPARARLIARTEMASLVNGGSLAMMDTVASATGDAYHKIWMTAPGAEWPRHEDYDDLDGQTVNLDDMFNVGGEQLDYPGDPDGDPGEVCNCRCTLRYGEGAAEKADAAEGTGDGGAPASFDETYGDTGGLTPQEVERAALRTPLGTPWPKEAPLLSEQGPLARRILKGNPDTEHLHMKPGGKLTEYNAVEEARHKRAYGRELKAAPSHVGEPDVELNATFLAGGSASGKSTLLESLEYRKQVPERYVGINSDKLKEDTRDYLPIKNSGDRLAAKYVHEESSQMAKELTQLAIERRSEFVLDGVGGGEPGKFLKKIQAAKEAGYTTHVELADVPLNEALARAYEREHNRNSPDFGRHVDPKAIVANHQEVAERFLEWRNSPLVDEWRLWATEGPIGKDLLVAERRRGQTFVYEQARYDQFVAKSHAMTTEAATFDARVSGGLTTGETSVRGWISETNKMKSASAGAKDWKYTGTEAVVLDRGRFFEAQPYPAKYRDGIGEPKACYTNAWKLAWTHPELTYVEGFAQPPGMPFPVHHAWTVDRAGRVVDPTWASDVFSGRGMEHTTYYGVPLSTDYVSRLYAEKGTDTVFDWQHRKVFEKGLPPEAQLGVPRDLGREKPMALEARAPFYEAVAAPLPPAEAGVLTPRPPASTFHATWAEGLEKELGSRYPQTKFNITGFDGGRQQFVVSDATAAEIANTYDMLAKRFPEVAAEIKSVKVDASKFGGYEDSNVLARTFAETGEIALNPKFYGNDPLLAELHQVALDRGWWPSSYREAGVASATLAHEFGHMVNFTYWPKLMETANKKAFGGEAALARKMFGTGWTDFATGYAATSPYEAFAVTFQMMVQGRVEGLTKYESRWVEGMRKELATKGVTEFVGPGGGGEKLKAFEAKLPEGIGSFKRVAAGDYETPDGRYRLWKIPDVNPPAWNVEDTKTLEILVDGAASKRDALGLLEDIPLSFEAKLPPSAETFGNIAIGKLEETKGFSLDAYGNPPTAKRYISSLATEHEVVLLPGNATARQLAEYSAEKQTVLNENPGSFLGGWKEKETGKVYMDVSTSFADEEQALRFAGSHGQKEIFDSQTGKSVKVPAAYLTETRRAGSLEGMLGAKEPRFPVQGLSDVSKPPGWEKWLSDAGTTPAEREALKNYTYNGFTYLNTALRGTEATSAEIQAEIDLIDRAIARAPRFPEPVTVWRGAHFSNLGPNTESTREWVRHQFVPGEIIDPGGFQSASFSSSRALITTANSSDVIFEIRTDHGALLADRSVSAIPGEYELLLGSKTRYRILRVLEGVKFEREPGNFLERTVVQVEAI